MNDVALDVPDEFVTVTFADPDAARLALGTTAVTCVALTYVVTNVVPFHCTFESEVKLVPFTFKFKSFAAPFGVLVGSTLAIDGTALLFDPFCPLSEQPEPKVLHQSWLMFKPTPIR